jgi:hypothetical protein
MVELVDTQDLKSCGHCGRAGSIPAPGTIFQQSLLIFRRLFCCVPCMINSGSYRVILDHIQNPDLDANLIWPVIWVQKFRNILIAIQEKASRKYNLCIMEHHRYNYFTYFSALNEGVHGTKNK